MHLFLQPPFPRWICKLSTIPITKKATTLENEVLACGMINDMLGVVGSIQRFINL